VSCYRLLNVFSLFVKKCISSSQIFPAHAHFFRKDIERKELLTNAANLQAPKDEEMKVGRGAMTIARAFAVYIFV